MSLARVSLDTYATQPRLRVAQPTSPGQRCRCGRLMDTASDTDLICYVCVCGAPAVYVHRTSVTGRWAFSGGDAA